MSEDPPALPAEALNDFDLQDKSPIEIIAGWRAVAAQWEHDDRAGNFQLLDDGGIGYAPSKEAEDAYAEQAKAVVRDDPEKARGLLEILDSAIARGGLEDEAERKAAGYDQKLLGHLLVDLTRQFPKESLPLWPEALSSHVYNPAHWELMSAIAEQKLPPEVLKGIARWITRDFARMSFEVRGARAWMQHEAARRLDWPQDPTLRDPYSPGPEWRGGPQKWLKGPDRSDGPHMSGS